MPTTESQQTLSQLLDPKMADVLCRTIRVFLKRDQSHWDEVTKRSKDKQLVAGLKRLSVMPFRNYEAACALLSFCLNELPQIEVQCETETDSPKKHLCALLRFLVMMALQGRSLYPHDPVDLGTRVLNLIKGNSRGSKQFNLLAEILTDSSEGTPRAGWNAVVAANTRRLIEHEVEQVSPWFDDNRFIDAKHKFNGYCKDILRNREFRSDWHKIKRDFNVASYQGTYGVVWPSWSKNTAAPATLDTNTEAGQFFVVFDFFCWKWFLNGMSGDNPFVEKPRYRLTPLGTEVFIPGYWSLDTHRDVLWKRVLELHRARGVPRQGAKLAKNRKDRKAQLKTLLRADQEARAKKLQGNNYLDYLKRKAGLDPRTDPSRRYLLLREAKRMFPASHAQP